MSESCKIWKYYFLLPQNSSVLIDLPLTVLPDTGCPRSWIYIAGSCYILHTNYNNGTVQSPVDADPLRYTQATAACEEWGGTVAVSEPGLFTTVKKYLQLWRHSPELGDIWVSDGSSQTGNVIDVRYLCYSVTSFCHIPFSISATNILFYEIQTQTHLLYFQSLPIEQYVL